MNRRQISALLVLKELGIKYEMESFEERLSVQKSMYLAQAAGVNIGHYFNWYLRGPYSPGLSKDVFGAIQNYNADTATDGWELDQGTRTKLGKLKKAFEPPTPLKKPTWLELLASVHFLIDRKQVASREPRSLMAQLAKYRKVYTQEQVTEALKRLRNIGLLSN